MSIDINLSRSLHCAPVKGKTDALHATSSL
jgi:hypothetical protein